MVSVHIKTFCVVQYSKMLKIKANIYQTYPCICLDIKIINIILKTIFNQIFSHQVFGSLSIMYLYNYILLNIKSLYINIIIPPYPVNAETGITMQSRFPIRWAFLLNIGLTSLTPIHSGISCLFANTNNGMPCNASLAIILSRKTYKLYNTLHKCTVLYLPNISLDSSILSLSEESTMQMMACDSSQY